MASSGREGLVWATTAILLIILMVDVDQMLGKKMVFLGTMGRVSKSSTPVVQKESNKNLLLQEILTQAANQLKGIYRHGNLPGGSRSASIYIAKINHEPE